jgi:hypothetical protein
MSQQLFEANDLDHDGVFLPKPSLGTERTDYKSTIQLTQLTRNINDEEEGSWLSPNRSGDGRNIISTPRLPRDQRKTNAADPTAPIQIISNTPKHAFTSKTSIWVHEHTKGGMVPTATPGEPSYTPHTKNIQSDPPSLVEEEIEGQTEFTGIISSKQMGEASTNISDDGYVTTATPSTNKYKISLKSPSGKSLHYFTADSSLSSLESLDYEEEQHQFMAAEARILAALENMNEGEVEDMDILLEMSLASSSSLIDRCFDFDRTYLCSSPSKTSHGDNQTSLNMRFDCDNHASPNETTEIFGLLVPYKFRPIESYFRRTSKPTKEALKPPSSLVAQQGTNGNAGDISLIQPCISEQQYMGERRKAKGHLMDTFWLIRCFQQLQNMNNPFYEKQYSEASLCFSRRFLGLRFIGTAMEKIELLRRCFYPRRDVIKWNCFETGGGRL